MSYRRKLYLFHVLPIALAAAIVAPTAIADMPMYSPPLRGAPAVRVGAGTRGTEDGANVSVFAPEHTGLTTQAQPVLYWYTSAGDNVKVEVTLIDEQSIDPLIEQRLSTSGGAGVHALRLADFGVSLEPGVDYQWSVALVPDPNQRSNDVFSSGGIKRVPEADLLKQELAAAPATEQAAIYARYGLWYDAMMALGAAIDRSPTDVAARGDRASLLEQVGLSEAAGYDRRAAN